MPGNHASSQHWNPETVNTGAPGGQGREAWCCCSGLWTGPWPLWLRVPHTWVKGREGLTLYPKVSPSSDAQGPVPTRSWVLPKPRGADLPESNTMPCWVKRAQAQGPKNASQNKYYDNVKF